MVIETVHGLKVTKLSLNERFTMISERAEAPARAPRSNDHKPVVDNFIKLSNEIAHLKAGALQRRLQLQAQQEQQNVRLSLLQQLRRYRAARLSGLPLAGTSAAAIPRMPADNNNDLSMMARRGQHRCRGRMVSPPPPPPYRWTSYPGDLSTMARREQHRCRGRVEPPPQPSRWTTYPGDRRQGVGWANTGRQRGLRAWQQATPARGQGMRGRGRGGIARQHHRPVTREQLDEELDQYMASSKAPPVHAQIVGPNTNN